MKTLEVNRTFYIICLCLEGLMLASSLLAGIFFFQMGDSLYATSGYKIGYVLGAILTIIEALLFMRYVYVKAYIVTFYTILISLVIGSLHMFVVFNMLYFWQLNEYFASTYLLILGFSLPYATSLVFSNSKERQYLKLAGILLLILNTTLFVAFLWGSSADVRLAAQIRNLHIWLSYGGNLILILFALNYYDEMKKFKSDGEIADLGLG